MNDITLLPLSNHLLMMFHWAEGLIPVCIKTSLGDFHFLSVEVVD
jgi:hypothetical protein